MHAASGESAGGAFIAQPPPVTGGVAVHARAAEVAFEMQQLAQAAILQHALDLVQRRLEAPVVTDRERHLVLQTRAHGGTGALHGEREGLLGKYVLAGARRGDDLPCVLRVGCREQHGVDLRIREHAFERAVEGKAFLRGIGRGFLRRAGDARDDADLLALAVHGSDEVASPVAESGDRCSYHLT
jgi:hypothetical protein